MAPGSHPRRRSALTARLVSSAGAGEPPRVLEDLREAILGGDGPPGTAIPIDTVARFFGVSPIPVREALRTLQGEGLVDHVPRSGYFVATLTFAEFRELYDVRQALEVSALRPAVDRAGSDDLQELRRCDAAFAEAVTGDDVRSYHQASRDFHRALIEPAGMPRLLSMYDGAWNMTESVQPMSHVAPTERAGFRDDHAAMLAAFEDRDTERLVELATAHYAHLRAAIAALQDEESLFRPDIRHA